MISTNHLATEYKSGGSHLVSVICPTTPDRMHFMPMLHKYFENQDYPNKELIIIDGKGTIGAKRNKGCELANGSIILHMDSDDYYAPDWISKSIEFLLQSGADITGLQDLYFSNGVDKYKYTYGFEQLPFIAGATMCYYKSVWERYKFPDIQIGEDNQFCWKSGAKITPHNYIDGFLATIHNGNTCIKSLSGEKWSKI